MYKFFKRLIDIICSLIGLILFSPILLVVALLIRINLVHQFSLHKLD